MRRSSSLLVLVLLLGLSAPLLWYGTVGADPGPGTYVEIFWDKENNYSFDTDLTVTDAPETAVVLFWSHQFHFVNGSGGYIGLQIVGSTRKAICSIWDAIDGEPGRPFTEEGEGWQLLIDYDWKLRQKYRLRVWASGDEENGDEWWSCSIYDFTSGQETVLGRILVPASWGWLGSWSVTWTEYAGYPTCESPYTRATFSGHVARHSSGDSPPVGLKVSYGGSGCPNSDVDYYGGTRYVLEAGDEVQRDTPEGDLTEAQREENVPVVFGRVSEAHTGNSLEGVEVHYYFLPSGVEPVGTSWYYLARNTTDLDGTYQILLDPSYYLLSRIDWITLEEVTAGVFILGFYRHGYLIDFTPLNLSVEEPFAWFQSDRIRIDIEMELVPNEPFVLWSGILAVEYWVEIQREFAELMLDAMRRYFPIVGDIMGVPYPYEGLTLTFEKDRYRMGWGGGGGRIRATWYPWYSEEIWFYNWTVPHEITHSWDVALLDVPPPPGRGRPTVFPPGWFREGLAGLVMSLANGVDFADICPNVEVPSSYDEYYEYDLTPMCSFAKVIQLVAIPHGGRSYIGEMMKDLVTFMREESALHDFALSHVLSYWELIMSMSKTSHENLTRQFVEDFNFDSRSLRVQRDAFESIRGAREHLRDLEGLWLDSARFEQYLSDLEALFHEAQVKHQNGGTSHQDSDYLEAGEAASQVVDRVRRTIIVDQSGAEGSRVDVGTVQRIYFHAIWLSNRSSVDNVLVYINSTGYATNSTGWIQLDVMSPWVGSYTWTATTVEHPDSPIYVQVAPDVQVIYDRVAVVLSAFDGRIDVGSTADISWEAHYEFDGAPFTGSITLNDTLSYSSVGRYGYTILEIHDSLHGLKEFQSNSVSIVFDRVVITLAADDDRIDLGSEATIAVDARYAYDGASLRGGVELSQPLVQTAVGRYQYSVSSIQDMAYGLTAFKSNTVSVIFDRVGIQLSVEDARINPGSSAAIEWMGVYEYDETHFQGSIELTNPLTRTTVGAYAYRAASISDDFYGLSAFTSNEVQVVFDKVSIELSVADGRIDVGSTARILVEAVYLYDGAPYDGEVFLTEELAQSEVGEYVYEVASVAGDTYGITAFEANSASVVFDEVLVQLSAPARWLIETVVPIEWTASYAFDGDPFQGSVSLSEDTVQSRVGAYQYEAISIRDDLYALSAFTSNTVEVVFDQVTVELSVNTVVPGQVLVEARLAFASDGLPIDDATVRISGVQARSQGGGVYTAILPSWWVTVTPAVEVATDGFLYAAQEFSSLAVGNVGMYLVVLALASTVALYVRRRK